MSAPAYEVRQVGKRQFATFLGGRQIGRAFASRSGAETEAARLQGVAERQAARLRSCLCCRAEFVSEGAHNRMCVKCRGHSEPVAV